MMNSKICKVGRLVNIRPHPSNPKLKVAEIDGHLLIVGDHYEEGNLGFYIPPGALLPIPILKDMWLWNEELQKGRLGGKKGNRCTAKEREGVVSDGLFYGAYYFDAEKRIETPSWKPEWQEGHDVSSDLGITFAD
jgi:hypothetical protein